MFCFLDVGDITLTSKSARDRISIGSIISDHFSVKHLSVIQRLLYACNKRCFVMKMKALSMSFFFCHKSMSVRRSL